MNTRKTVPLAALALIAAERVPRLRLLLCLERERLGQGRGFTSET